MKVYIWQEYGSTSKLLKESENLIDYLYTFPYQSWSLFGLFWKIDKKKNVLIALDFIKIYSSEYAWSNTKLEH